MKKAISFQRLAISLVALFLLTLAPLGYAQSNLLNVGGLRIGTNTLTISSNGTLLINGAPIIGGGSVPLNVLTNSGTQSVSNNFVLTTLGTTNSITFYGGQVQLLGLNYGTPWYVGPPKGGDILIAAGNGYAHDGNVNIFSGAGGIGYISEGGNVNITAAFGVNVTGTTFTFNGVPVSVGGGSDGSSTNMMHPVFIIPMRDGTQQWTEFELKASTNNYASGDMNSIAYWLESIGDQYNDGVNQWNQWPRADLNAKIFYVNPLHAPDFRSWKTWDRSSTLTEQLLASGVGGDSTFENVVVIPSFTVQDGSTNVWMYRENPSLIWSYRRRTSSAGEVNNEGQAAWHPIVPVDWRNTVTTP